MCSEASTDFLILCVILIRGRHSEEKLDSWCSSPWGHQLCRVGAECEDLGSRHLCGLGHHLCGLYYQPAVRIEAAARCTELRAKYMH